MTNIDYDRIMEFKNSGRDLLTDIECIDAGSGSELINLELMAIIGHLMRPNAIPPVVTSGYITTDAAAQEPVDNTTISTVKESPIKRAARKAEKQ